MRIEDRAYEYAALAHSGQKRKYTGDPYIDHCVDVALLVKRVTDDREIVAAALLHDVVEDTSVTIKMIQYDFGKRIAGLVDDLTDVSTLDVGNRKTRKALDLKHTALAHPDAKTIKLADIIDNSISIMRHDPGFAKIYMAEKRDLMKVLQEGDVTLYSYAWKIISRYLKGRMAMGS
jgi:(p)ppGpp synthase/HD superfamily hydrolase